MKPALLSTTEAAERLGLSPARVRQLIAHDQLPAVRVGNRWVVAVHDVEAFSRLPPGRPHRGRSL
jgi:excisionase family DNA binding protein